MAQRLHHFGIKKTVKKSLGHTSRALKRGVGKGVNGKNKQGKYVHTRREPAQPIYRAHEGALGKTNPQDLAALKAELRAGEAERTHFEGTAGKKERASTKRAENLRKRAAAYCPYVGNVLVVGEANFSFAHSLCVRLRERSGGGKVRMLATSLDSDVDLVRKYKNDVMQHIEGVHEPHSVAFGVDATRLHRNRAVRAFLTEEGVAGSGSESDGELHAAHRSALYDFIVFAFPQASKQTGRERSAMDVSATGLNQELLRAFFASASQMLAPRGEIHVVLKEGEPYKSWKVGIMCSDATEGELVVKTASEFVPESWPAYSYRRTVGFNSAWVDGDMAEVAEKAKIYIFSRKANKVKT